MSLLCAFVYSTFVYDPGLQGQMSLNRIRMRHTSLKPSNKMTMMLPVVFRFSPAGMLTGDAMCQLETEFFPFLSTFFLLLLIFCIKKSVNNSIP